MKIIFDSEEQKKKMLMVLSGSDEMCPSDFGFNDEDPFECEPDNPTYCFECWKRCGLEMEVKETEIKRISKGEMPPMGKYLIFGMIPKIRRMFIGR